MFKLNRMTEYALIALRHISRKEAPVAAGDSQLTSAREIADVYGLPFEITAKTLQKLKDQGLIDSVHGAKGGYSLKRPLAEVSLGQFLEMMEGPQSVVVCAAGSHSTGSECEYGVRCEIKDVMSRLNSKVQGFLAEISLAELADHSGPTAIPNAIPVAISKITKEASL